MFRRLLRRREVSLPGDTQHQIASSHAPCSGEDSRVVISSDSRFPVLLTLAGIAVVVAGSVGLAARSSGATTFHHVAAVAVAGGVAVLALAARPAWTLSLGLALAVFSGEWSHLSSPVPLDRVVIALGIISTLVRERRRTGEPLRTRPIDWLLMIVALYAVGSAYAAGTLGNKLALFRLLDRFSLVGFALFYVAPIAFRDARDRRILLGVLVALGAYLGLTALFETTGPHGLVFPSYINNPAVGIHFGRARGPFVEAAANGLALYGCAVAACIAAVTWVDRRARGAAVCVMVLCLLGTLFTLTRSVWIGVGVATVISLLAARETRRLALPAVALGALIVVIALATVPGLEANAVGRANDQSSVWDRENSDAAALRMVAARPILGFGWGSFATSSPGYYRQSPNYPLTAVPEVHDVYLSNAVELGLVGAGLWLLAIVSAVGLGVARRGPPELRRWKIGLIAVSVSVAVVAVATPLAYTMPVLLLWGWAGITWAPVRFPPKGPEVPQAA